MPNWYKIQRGQTALRTWIYAVPSPPQWQAQSCDDNGDGEYSLKQVELNTIASSFAGLASTVAKLHKFLTKRMEDDGEKGQAGFP